MAIRAGAPSSGSFASGFLTPRLEALDQPLALPEFHRAFAVVSHGLNSRLVIGGRDFNGRPADVTRVIEQV